MDEFDESEKVAKSYLLGEMGEAEREQFEEQFFLDPDFKELVMMVEDELIEDYAAGTLEAESREKFIRNYLTTPHQMRKLKVTKALNEYADSHPISHPALTPNDPQEKPNGLRAMFSQWRASRRFFRLATVTFAVVLCAVIAGVVIFKQSGLKTTLSQKLKDLNTPNAVNVADRPDILNVTLSSVRVRSGGQTTREVVMPSGTSFVRLTLDGVPASEGAFNVEMSTLEGQEVFTVTDVAAKDIGGKRQVVVNVPPEFLKRGDYLLKLSKANTSAPSEVLAEYFLRISA